MVSKSIRKGNVYAGCGDGLNVWNDRGVLLGKVKVDDGVVNFVVWDHRRLVLMNELWVWEVQVDESVGLVL